MLARLSRISTQTGAWTSASPKPSPVRSPVGVRFRRWVNDKLKEYLVKGFVLDDARDIQYRLGHAKWDNFLNRIV